MKTFDNLNLKNVERISLLCKITWVKFILVEKAVNVIE